MLYQILIGSVVIFATVFVQSGSIMCLDMAIKHWSKWVYSAGSFVKNTCVLSLIVIGLVFGMTITCWVWAFVFVHLDIFANIEESLYFAIVTFATLGYGDIVLDSQWRILSSLTALNGLILVGLNTAYLAQTFTNIKQRQHMLEKTSEHA